MDKIATATIMNEKDVTTKYPWEINRELIMDVHGDLKAIDDAYNREFTAVDEVLETFEERIKNLEAKVNVIYDLLVKNTLR
jgi:dihydroorotase